MTLARSLSFALLGLAALSFVTACPRTVTVATTGSGGAAAASAWTTGSSSGQVTASSTGANATTGPVTETSGGIPTGVCANTVSAMYGTGLLSPGSSDSSSTGGGCETNQKGHATDPQCCSCITCAREKYCGTKLSAFQNNPNSAAWVACVFPNASGSGGCPNDNSFAQCVAACAQSYPGVQAQYIALLNCAVCETCAYNCNAYAQLGNCTSVPNPF